MNHETAKLFFRYEDGHLYWLQDASKRLKTAGKLAGHTRPDGYRVIRFGNVKYLAHRIIFLLHHGYLPPVIDHIDGDPRNNRIENLRECTMTQNQMNRKIQRSNTHGNKNMYWHSRDKRWVVRLTIDGRVRCVGGSKDLELAELIAIEARDKYHGRFARHT